MMQEDHRFASQWPLGKVHLCLEQKMCLKRVCGPGEGGKECEPKELVELGKCPRRCKGQKFCEWLTWGELLGWNSQGEETYLLCL